MEDQFKRGKVIIVSKSERTYDIIEKQNCVIIKRRSTPAVYPDYVKPRPIPHRNKVDENNPIKIVNNKPAVVTPSSTETSQPKPINDVSLVSPISNSFSFEELQKKVEKMREQEDSKKSVVETEQNNPVDDEIPIVTMEDADDLANGVISEEQELITRDYLKSLTPDVLKRVYYVSTGKRWSKGLSKFEMRQEILSAYKEATSKRKQVIYESSRE